MPTVVATAGSDAAIRVADTAETCSEVRPSGLASRDTVVVGEVLLAALNELDSAVAWSVSGRSQAGLRRSPSAVRADC
ncbi:hypothetical protein OG381_00865 [Streptomyces sp. NBC_00490]|uniref:hypothetical protein n=1 Tax=Streptomyces sp. NBC_00490 TaxID=2903657 RepID=UPI002E19172A